MCTMQNEHREYFVQSMPIDRMSCVKTLGQSLQNGNSANKKNIGYSMALFSFIFLI